MSESKLFNGTMGIRTYKEMFDENIKEKYKEWAIVEYGIILEEWLDNNTDVINGLVKFYDKVNKPSDDPKLNAERLIKVRADVIDGLHILYDVLISQLFNEIMRTVKHRKIPSVFITLFNHHFQQVADIAYQNKPENGMANRKLARPNAINLMKSSSDCGINEKAENFMTCFIHQYF
jgi:hypothetical protein